MSAYKDKLDTITFSFSSLSQFDKCPYAFALNKIMDIKGDGNAHSQIGSFGHELFEQLYKKEITKQEALEKCVDDFDINVTYEISEASYDRKYFALSEAIENFDETVFDKYEILGVEKQMFWNVGKYRMVGVADLILKDKKTGDVLLVDHKSASHFLKKNGTPLKNMEDSYELYKKQMYLYAYAMKETMGILPNKIVWNHFLDGGKQTVIDFNEEDMNKAIAWALDTIERIYATEDFTAEYSYMMCSTLCNYRNGDCEWKDFLREEEEEE